MARPHTRISYYALEGGLDVVTPAISIKPGRALAMLNFEPWYQGGYRRIPGYERFDGRPKPSDATFTGFDVSTVAGLTLGDTITGDTSSTTGILVGIWDDDGTYGSDAIGVTKVSGAGFDNGETCNTAAFTIQSAPITRYSPNVDLEKIWLLEAESSYRDDIAIVAGSGQVRGAWQRLGDNYAVRNNAGATAGVLFTASATGWTTTGITMADYIHFDAGLAAGATVAEGDTLTGGTSGATATIHRIVLHGGSNAWDGSGEGYFVLTGVAGGPFQNNESLESPALTAIATADGANTTFAFPVGGVYRFINHNFFGGANTYRAYGVNGVGPGFEIDENKVVSPILMPNNVVTGSAPAPASNIPFLIEEHRGHLFMGFPGGSLQHSAPGEPLIYSGFLGAGEFGMGDELTSLNSVVGNVLAVSTRRTTHGLFGTDATNWELRVIGEQSGSVLYGSQKIDTVYSLDDLGITSLARTDQFGDFAASTVSKQVQPIVNELRPTFTDSSIVRESNQYRIYFEDNTCLVMYVPAGSQSLQRTTRRYVSSDFGVLKYDIPVTQIYNTDDANGVERTYFVTSDATFEGYVFEDQIGRNFDGEPIPSYVRTAFNHFGSPSHRKRFRRADLELNASDQLTIKFNSELTYSAADTPTTVSDITVLSGGGIWDVDNWDEFSFDGQIISTARAELRGSGENIGFLIYNETATADPWVMQGLTVHYDLRRLKR